MKTVYQHVTKFWKKVNIIMSGECVISLVLSHHNKNLKWRTNISALRRTSITAPCYSSILFRKQRKIHPKVWGHADPKDTKREERERNKRVCTCMGERLRPFGSSFYVCFPPPGLPYVIWASQECCLFYLRSSLWSSDLLCSIFMGFSFSCLLATTILDSFFLF